MANLCKSVFFSNLVLVVCLVSSCNPNHNNDDKLNENSINTTNSTVLDSIIYPNVTYQLGKAAYVDLFLEMIENEGAEEYKEVFYRILKCRELFENDNGNKAFTETLTLLAELLEKNKEDDSIVSELLLAEALYQASRSFYYERNEVLNPTSSLIEIGISISKAHMYSENPLIQQVALFQLARLFDVLEGLTQQYSAYIEALSPSQLVFASSNSLHIKRDILGLKGGPLLRSYSNNFIDNTQLCGRGYLEICNTVLPDILKDAYTQFDYLDANDRSQYGEFINVLLYELTSFYIDSRDFKSAKGLIEKSIALKMNVQDYNLGDTLQPFDLIEGISHHSALLILSISEYIQASNEIAYKNVLFQLTKQLENKSVDVFEKAEAPNSLAYNEMGAISYYKDGKPPEEVNLLKTESSKFNYLQSLYKFYSLQEYEFLAKTDLVHSDTEYEKLFTTVYESENKLRNSEIKLNSQLDTEVLLECVGYYSSYKENQQKANSKLIGDILSINLLDINSIRAKLNKNESWITFFKEGKVADEFTMVLVNDTKVLFTVVSLDEKITSEGLSVNMVMNKLENSIVANKPWSVDDAALVSLLANRWFENFINPECKHIIISNLGFMSSRIWEVIIRTFDFNKNEALKSIRYDDRFIFDFKKSDDKIISNWLAMAPKFTFDQYSLEESERQDLMSRLRGASLIKYNPWYSLNQDRKYSSLVYNTEEVLEVNKYIDGAVYIGSDANESMFNNLPSKNSVIHIASHAFLDENDIYRSGIVLSRDSVSADSFVFDNILYAYEIRKMKLDAELVVLSACETGISPMRQGGVDWSLGRAFIEAGCRNTVTSLWNVDDKSTHDIIIDFYKELKNGSGKAEALYTAKTKYIKKHPGENPHYWTPLILSGDNKPINFK